MAILSEEGSARSLQSEPSSDAKTRVFDFILMKEVLHPHLPVGIPCYDFTLVTSPALGIPLLTVRVTT